MLTCPKCGFKEQVLKWFKSGNTYHASSKHENIKYKIEKENNVYWFYYEGAKTKRRKLPVCFNVFIFDGFNWNNGQGFITLEEAKNYCFNYENQ